MVCAYYVFLAAVAGLLPREKRTNRAAATPTFAILIPAHNEEAGLPSTLLSCAELDYPADRCQVYVIADNCSDRTAAVAREAGVVCLERHDLERRGKGQALAWALERILPHGHDAVIVLDADCRLDRHALRVFDECLARGDRVLQASYVTANPDDSSVSYASAVGNLLENELFYAPKSRLGLAVFLRGTGMVFHRSILEQHPWQAHSVVEDAEYTLHLLRAGLRVRFVPDVRVLSDFPTQASQLGVQRRRWATGNFQFGKAQALRLLGQGLLQRRGTWIDLGWTLLVLSRPLILLELAATLLSAVVAVWWARGILSSGLLVAAVTVALLQGLYFASGIALLGVNVRRMGLLLQSVAVVGRLMTIALRGLFRSKDLGWARTPRMVGSRQ